MQTRTIKKNEEVVIHFPIDGEMYTVTAKYTGKKCVSDGHTYHQFWNQSADSGKGKHYTLSEERLPTLLGGGFEDCAEFTLEF